MGLLAFAVHTRAQQGIIVDANAEPRAINSSFSSIKVTGGINLYLAQGDVESIAVSASDQGFRDGIKTIVEKGRLRIYYEGEKGWGIKNKKLKVYVSCKTIAKIEASGASDVTVVTGYLQADALSLSFSGASDFKGDVKVKELELDLSGASDITISGTASSVKVASSGASDIKGYGLVTDVLNANASGASDINITVNKEINAHASGASNIYYRGEARLKEVHSSGASSIGKKG